MSTRLQPLTLRDFTGGLNVRDNSFQLGDNESPAMLNVHVDSRVGFATRGGWVRWTPIDDATITTWDPRNAMLHQYHDEAYAVYIANNGVVYRTDVSGNLVATPITCFAADHLADFVAWGDTLYIATGAGHPTWKYDITEPTPTLSLTQAGVGQWNENYTTPGIPGSVAPSASVMEAHAGYLFCGHVYEDKDGGGLKEYPNRIRWSHPNQPEDWAEEDFLDIETGGSRIRALQSFQDHLLIFKDSTVWALYGYDLDSWQLVQVSNKSGCESPTAVTASETSCFYYSPTGRSAIYEITSGNRPASITEPIRQVMSEATLCECVWLNWASNRLFAALPWKFETAPVSAASMDGRRGRSGGTTDESTTTFIFDPAIGEGAWEAHAPAFGSLRTVVEFPSDKAPMAVHVGDGGERCLLRLGAIGSDAVDFIKADGSSTPFDVFYTTNWKDAGTEELRKSWRRPRFIINNPEQDLELRVDAFRNYDLGAPYRSWVVGVTSFGRTYWRDLGAVAPEGDGFDWDDGSLWEGETRGSRIVRGGPLGIARSIQLRFTPTPTSLGRSWGIDAVTLKFIQRRFTT